MNIKKILNSLDENDVLIMHSPSVSDTPAICDESDRIEIIDGVECIMLRHESGETPIPTKVFESVTIMSKLDFVMMEMFMGCEK